jgi:hypothetical protein
VRDERRDDDRRGAAELEVAQAALDEVLRLEGAAAPSAESI